VYNTRLVTNNSLGLFGFSSLYKRAVKLAPPVKMVTPYGGKLIYTLPGDNKMVVHLKDKNKIRHRKRWSQVG